MPPKKAPIKVDVTIAAEVQKLDIKDGDLLVMKIRATNPLSSEELAQMRKKFSEHIQTLNANARVIAFMLPPPDDIEFVKIAAGEPVPADVQAELDREVSTAPGPAVSEDAHA